MSKPVKTLAIVRDLLVLAAVQAERLDVPQWRFDGEEAKAEDVAAELRIPIEEAMVRMYGPSVLKKDVYGGMASHSVSMGVGTTIQQRIGKFVQRCNDRRKKRRRKKT